MTRYAHLAGLQRVEPMRVVQPGGRGWWWFENSFYWESASYSSRDVVALVRDRQRKLGQRLDRAHMLLDIEEGRATPDSRPRREPIPREKRRAGFEGGGGRCGQCGSKFVLQYDHVRPAAVGGASTVENLQILCGQCNQEKGADL